MNSAAAASMTVLAAAAFAAEPKIYNYVCNGGNFSVKIGPRRFPP
ncbi:MAG TPA: hypothetical protein VJR71_00795 [Pseudolabrys sp.]|nr:hypothetical protein [Pseudolabrys sp.]